MESRMRRRNAAIDSALEQRLLDLLPTDARGERGAEMELELGFAAERDRHGQHQQPPGLVIEPGPRPDITPGIARDDIEEIGIERGPLRRRAIDMSIAQNRAARALSERLAFVLFHRRPSALLSGLETVCHRVNPHSEQTARKVNEPARAARIATLKGKPPMRLMLALLVALLACWAAPAVAQPGDRCAALARASFAALPDAPTTIVSASTVAAAGDLPAYCRIEGRIAPRIGFEARLPLSGWNGKYLQQGCGGMCGGINMGACEDALARGYAVANTDMGHKGAPFAVTWAKGDREAEIDFGYRATHVLSVAAKAIVTAHYGVAPKRSYFRGCSTGGRQAMILAQRFPEDFDGIIAGAPVLSEIGDGILHLLWSGRASVDAAGRPVLSEAKVRLARAAVLAACDRIDRVADGVLQDPRRCGWQAATLRCQGPARADCLTDVEIAAIEKIYAGAHDSRGRRLFPGGMARGSEHQWAPAFVGVGDAPPLVLDPKGMIPDFMRYLSFHDDLPPDSDPMLAFDWDRDPPRLAMQETLFNAQNPDLRAFKARGGKLILYHGWDDLEIPPALSIDYYETATRTMGGAEATRDFFRLFMVPGMAHCRRGPGADAIDYLSALESWVEEGTAPARLLAHHLIKEQSYLGLPPPRYPLARAAYDWARPVLPYPGVARWSGRGDWRDPATWR